jgi:hypothetical protein
MRALPSFEPDETAFMRLVLSLEAENGDLGPTRFLSGRGHTLGPPDHASIDPDNVGLVSDNAVLVPRLVEIVSISVAFGGHDGELLLGADPTLLHSSIQLRSRRADIRPRSLVASSRHA